MANRPILRGAKIGVKVHIFLLGVITIAPILVFQNSRPTSAESFLYPITCIVGKLIDPECSRVVAPEPAPATQPQPTGQSESPPSALQSQPAEQQAGAQSIPADSGQAAQPLNIQPGELEEVPSPTSAQVGGAKFPSSIGGSAQSLQLAFLGAQTNGRNVVRSAVLQPSDQGWVIWGIVWYWWLIAVGAVLVTALLPRKVTQQ